MRRALIALLLAIPHPQAAAQTFTIPSLKVTGVSVSPSPAYDGGLATIRCHVQSGQRRTQSRNEYNAATAAQKKMGGTALVMVSVDNYLVGDSVASTSGVVDLAWKVWANPASKVPHLGPHSATCKVVPPGGPVTEESTTFTVAKSTVTTAQADAGTAGPQAAGLPQGGNAACVASLKVDLVPAIPPGAEGAPVVSAMTLPFTGSTAAGNKVTCSYGLGAPAGVSYSYAFACTNPKPVGGPSWSCMVRRP